MSKQLLSEQEAVSEVSEGIASASGKRWMIAVWCMDQAEENGKPPSDVLRLVNRTTWRFPRESFEESLRLLRENLDEEMQAGEPPVPTPLDPAPFVLHKGGVDPDDGRYYDAEDEETESKKDEPHLDELPEPPKGGAAP